jgi:glycosyltransferase involved in cell wall biosynthesis
MTTPLASVVIPTRNRPAAVESCLESLAAQTLPPRAFEVIVVDDGSEPPLALDPARWATKFELKLVRQQNTGPAGARNRGATEARGEFLAFTDDDCLPTPHWLEKLIAALRKNPEALVGGSTFNGLQDDIYAETSQLLIVMVYEHFNRNPANAYFFASNNMACLKNCFSKLGGFDVAFPWAGAEDREFCDRWRIQKWPLFWEQTARIEHRHAQSLPRFLRLYWRYGQGAFLYHAKRNKRASGTMADDLGFHRNLPKVVLAKISSYPLGKRTQLLVALMLWQIANAMGFFYEMARTHKGSPRAKTVYSLF